MYDYLKLAMRKNNIIVYERAAIKVKVKVRMRVKVKVRVSIKIGDRFDVMEFQINDVPFPSVYNVTRNN